MITIHCSASQYSICDCCYCAQNISKNKIYHFCLTVSNIRTLWKFSIIALCCYPNLKGSVRNLGLSVFTATIFLQFNYLRENIWVRISLSNWHYSSIVHCQIYYSSELTPCGSKCNRPAFSPMSSVVQERGEHKNANTIRVVGSPALLTRYAWTHYSILTVWVIRSWKV